MGAALPSSPAGGGRRRRRRRTSAPMAEINVTPFVDVVLVLLIVFMVAAPMLNNGVPLDLPKTATSALPQQDEEPLVLSTSADQTVRLQSTVMPREEVIAKLRAVMAQRSSQRIELQTEAGVPFEDFAVLLAALKKAGFTQIDIKTDPGGPSLDPQVAE
ncbi:MAG: biopolymer transporter ExbD [Paracoccaceae bacterium]